MSCSTLFGITPDFRLEEIELYPNAWYFAPTIWNVFEERYRSELEALLCSGYVKLIGLNGDKVWRFINDKMNASDNVVDRICWELTQQQIFFAKDKELVADCILRFLDENAGSVYNDDGDDVLGAHRSRFLQVANDIRKLDNRYPYFVHKNTSCDDSVEYWFENSLAGCTDYVCEFVVVKEGKIESFVGNLDFDYAIDKRTDA